MQHSNLNENKIRNRKRTAVNNNIQLCYNLDLVFPPKAHIQKTRSAVWYCWKMGTFKRDALVIKG